MSDTDPIERRRQAVRDSMQDEKAVGEPLVGPALRMLLIVLVVGAPMLLMSFAVIHMDNVRSGMVLARAMGGMPPDLTDTDLYFIVATSPGLILYSLAFALGLTTAVLLVLAVIALVWFAVASIFSVGRGRAAHRRYRRMVGEEPSVAPDAWERDLPEPDSDPVADEG